jgi:hypothetical protein
MSDTDEEYPASSSVQARRESATTSAGTAEPSLGADSGTERRRRKKSAGRQEVRIEFNNPTLNDPYFGIGNRTPEARRAATGTKTAVDIVAELDGYVEPECFADARRCLEQNHLVVLEGPSGFGKRASAFALLHALAPGDVEQLAPTVTLEELCSHGYRSGVGYLVADHTSHERGAEAEFRWDTLPAQIRRAGAYLVVTTAAKVEHGRSVSWLRPDEVALLSELLQGTDGGHVIADKLAERIPDDWTMADIVECARRVRDKPGQLEEALEVFDLASIGEVRAWFDGARDRRDIVEVTALAFTSGANERRFESVVIALEEALAEHLPVPEPSEDANAGLMSGAIPTRRKSRRGGGLIQIERITTDVTQRRVLVFKSPRHRQHVLAALAATYETPLWDAVQDWLLAFIEGDDPSFDEIIEVAQGIAMFAEVDFDETLDLFLEPLSRGDAGPEGMTCAAAVLRLMSLEDALAPAALQVAVRWINDGGIHQRITAGDALIAELGVRYPAEAARRLWQLITQDHELADIAVVTPAFLLYNLVDSGGDAADVLDLLERQITRFGKPGHDLRMVDLTMEMVLSALAVGDKQTGRLAVFDLVARYQDSAGPVARLWARVLCNRRYRVRALEALWDGLHGSKDQVRDADVLGAALGRALSPGEYPAFIRDFRSIDVRKRQRDKVEVESIAHLLIEALERMHLRTPTKD